MISENTYTLHVNILNVESLFDSIINDVDNTGNITNNDTRPECSGSSSISGNCHYLHMATFIIIRT